jgi:hypothetical protein
VLASHDSGEKNNELARLFEELYDKDRNRLNEFHFVFTGGTFDRIVLGKSADKQIEPMRSDVAKFIRERATCLPQRVSGGVTLLANFIVQRQISIVWTFFSPITVHWLSSPENLALMRLCDI